MRREGGARSGRRGSAGPGLQGGAACGRAGVTSTHGRLQCVAGCTASRGGGQGGLNALRAAWARGLGHGHHPRARADALGRVCGAARPVGGRASLRHTVGRQGLGSLSHAQHSAVARARRSRSQSGVSQSRVRAGARRACVRVRWRMWWQLTCARLFCGASTAPHMSIIGKQRLAYPNRRFGLLPLPALRPHSIWRRPEER